MASSKEYLQFILEQLSELNEITYRAMMGEYIIYYRGKIVGGIYDNRLLVKPTQSAISYMPNVTFEIPYTGAKEMLLVEDIDNKIFLTNLFNIMYPQLSEPKTKKKTSWITLLKKGQLNDKHKINSYRLRRNITSHRQNNFRIFNRHFKTLSK